jgi:hypothetical protein
MPVGSGIRKIQPQVAQPEVEKKFNLWLKLQAPSFKLDSD